MNAHWFRQNKWLVSFLAVFAVVLVILLWQVWAHYAAYKQTQAALEEKIAHLQRLENANPTPNERNVAICDENHKQLREVQRALFALLLRAAKVQPTKIDSNIEFAQQLRKTIARMEENVAKAGIAIPPDFRFGFKRYATTIPRKGLPRVLLEQLGKQLLVVEDLVSQMIEARVEQIYAIKRVEIEPLPPNVSLGEDALPETRLVHAQEHYTSMPFELRFACSGSALQSFLNRIARDEKFFVVTVLNVEQEVVEKRPEGSAASVPPEGPTPDDGTKVVVLTPDRTPRLRVTMRVEFVEVAPLKAIARTTQ